MSNDPAELIDECCGQFLSSFVGYSTFLDVLKYFSLIISKENRKNTNYSAILSSNSFLKWTGVKLRLVSDLEILMSAVAKVITDEKAIIELANSQNSTEILRKVDLAIFYGRFLSILAKNNNVFSSFKQGFLKIHLSKVINFVKLGNIVLKCLNLAGTEYMSCIDAYSKTMHSRKSSDQVLFGSTLYFLILIQLESPDSGLAEFMRRTVVSLEELFASCSMIREFRGSLYILQSILALKCNSDRAAVEYMINFVWYANFNAPDPLVNFIFTHFEISQQNPLELIRILIARHCCSDLYEVFLDAFLVTSSLYPCRNIYERLSKWFRYENMTRLCRERFETQSTQSADYDLFENVPTTLFREGKYTKLVKISLDRLKFLKMNSDPQLLDQIGSLEEIMTKCLKLLPPYELDLLALQIPDIDDIYQLDL